MPCKDSAFWPGVAARTRKRNTATPALPAPTQATLPVPQGLLPAPLIFSRDGQLYRLAADGVRATQLTDEPVPAPDAAVITAFDVSPADGSLAYLVQQADTGGQVVQALVLADADGGNRRVLLTSTSLTQPRFSPDGAQIAFGIVPALASEAAGLVPGVYRVDTAGGAPELVQPSASFATLPAPTEARAYAPSSWSPDGSKLALQAFMPASEFCETAIKDLASGAIVIPQAPEGLVTSCRAAAWSADSQILYIPLYEPGMFGRFAGIAQTSVGDGELTVPLGNKVGASWISLIGLTALPDTTYRAFVATSATPFSAEPGGPALRYGLHALTLDGQLTPLRDDSQHIWGGPLWATDGSGAVILSSEEPASTAALMWVPTDGGQPVTLVSGVQTGELRWGK